MISKIVNRKMNTLTDKIASGIFSLLFVLNICFVASGTISLIWNPLSNIPKALLLLIVSYILLQLLFALNHFVIRKLHNVKIPFVTNMSNKVYFFIVWIILMAICLIYAIIRYPAGMEGDAATQIVQYMGVQPLTAHWPPFSSAVMGIPVVITYNITGDLSLSVFVEVIVQSLICTCVFAYAITFIKQLDISPIFSLLALTIITIVPIFPGFLTVIVKDSYYSAMIVWLLILLASLLFLDKKNYVLIGIAAMLVSLLRNNGVYIVVILLISLLITISIQNKDKKILAIILGSVCILWILYSNVLLRVLNIPKGSIAEALSIPFQQTARLYRDFPTDIPGEENEIISKVLDTNSLAAIYDPVLSDAVKSTYSNDSASLGPYLMVWLKQFFRHPISYLDATLANSYGFWGPLAEENDRGYIFGLYMGNHIFGYTGRGDIVWKFPDALRNLCTWVLSWTNHLVLAPFWNFGLQIWLMIYVFINTLVKKYQKQLLITLPIVLSLLICIASPTWWNNGFRYALPIVFFNPFLVAINLMNDKKHC